MKLFPASITLALLANAHASKNPALRGLAGTACSECITDTCVPPAGGDKEDLYAFFRCLICGCSSVCDDGKDKAICPFYCQAKNEPDSPPYGECIKACIEDTTVIADGCAFFGA